jgi:hypothetical protein
MATSANRCATSRPLQFLSYLGLRDVHHHINVHRLSLLWTSCKNQVGSDTGRNRSGLGFPVRLTTPIKQLIELRGSLCFISRVFSQNEYPLRHIAAGASLLLSKK